MTLIKVVLQSESRVSNSCQLAPQLPFFPPADLSVSVNQSLLHYICTSTIFSFLLGELRQFSDQNTDPLPLEREPLRQLHTEIAGIAAKALVDKNIPLVEWGAQVQWRCGYPLVLVLVEWAVPDELLSLASLILSDCGIPCVPPSGKVTQRYGQWERAGFIHCLNPTGPERRLLYPLSFIGLTLQDTVEVTSTFNNTLRILTPKPRLYMLSLIHHLLSRPIDDSSRYQAHDDLLGFIFFYVLHDTPLYTKDGNVEDDESEEDFQKRVDEAVQDMKNWDWSSTEEKYLTIAERVVRHCRTISQLSSCGKEQSPAVPSQIRPGGET